jgi:hypothetical protein
MEDHTCSGCGNDLEHTLKVHEPYDVDTETVCWGCRAKAVMERYDLAEHEAEDKAAGTASPHRSDGRHYTVRPMTLEELEAQ